MRRLLRGRPNADPLETLRLLNEGMKWVTLTTHLHSEASL
jgi:hypothetical protein